MVQATAPATKSAEPAPPAAPTAPAPAPLPQRPQLPMRPLPLGRMKVIRASEANFASLLGAVLPTGTKLEDVLIPEFWSLTAPLLHAGDQVEIHMDDGSLFARLLVRQVGGSGNMKTWANVAVLEKYEFGPLEPPKSAKTHEVRHQGPHLKYTVVRIADNRTVADGFETPAAAEAAIQAILRRSVA